MAEDDKTLRLSVEQHDSLKELSKASRVPVKLLVEHALGRFIEDVHARKITITLTDGIPHESQVEMF